MHSQSRILTHPTSAAPQAPERLALLYKAAADLLRLHILRLLRTESLGVLEMCSILDIRQSALSHHLKVLFTASLVSTRREGNAIFYRRAFLAPDDPFAAQKRSIFSGADLLPLAGAAEARLAAVKQQREQHSREFFTRVADRFQQNQELVAELQQYAGSLRDLLHGLALPAHATVLEVGPGAGNLLALLSQVGGRVIALDNSAEMLGKARATVASAALHNVELMLGDPATALARGLKADLVIFSMVLHHLASPATAFADSAKLLEAGGCLLIVDLCRHNQDWVRDSCGDLWRGFEPEELSGWAAQAGFEQGQSLFLSLRNGFQVQMRLFHLPRPLATLPFAAP
ncbi:MAG: metalloregulator ArsR/SmtB family transcription factor [Pseudomonadales bacterium]|jgi:ArsR family transcriptional regulator|nr:metalloregulator ArsR/SmtB family transcription factor [Pseudomonadales bacterium]